MSNTDGKVVDMLVETGDRTTAGQLLVVVKTLRWPVRQLVNVFWKDLEHTFSHVCVINHCFRLKNVHTK